MAQGSKGCGPECLKAPFIMDGVAPCSIAFFHIMGKNDFVIVTLEFHMPEEIHISL